MIAYWRSKSFTFTEQGVQSQNLVQQHFGEPTCKSVLTDYASTLSPSQTPLPRVSEINGSNYRNSWVSTVLG